MTMQHRVASVILSALALVSPHPSRGQSAAPATAAPAHLASDRVEKHIARLHHALKITPAQAPQWNAFAQVMRDNAAHMDSVTRDRAAGLARMNAVDGLKSYEQVTQAHLEDLQKLEPAFEALYATLSDAQKKAADAMFRTPGSRAD